MQTRKIAIMGFGTVGRGAYDILTRNREYIRKTRGTDIEIKAILDRSPAPLKACGADVSLFRATADEIAADCEIELVIETMGGVEPARTFITAMLSAGKSVVTANKELLAKHGAELERVAAEHDAGLFFEASCVGGVPIIRALESSFQGDRINSIYGIINGTTNYILSKMSAEGCDYDAALAGARALGYAEADSTADVEGYDAAYKLSILGSLAFRTRVPYERIFREGITSVTSQDIYNAHQLGYEIKLLAIGKRNGDALEARVHPVFVPTDHPLAAVTDAYNAVYLNGDFVGDLMFYGAGAGAHPTGSAIVSDVITALTGGGRVKGVVRTDGEAKLVKDFISGYYICVTVDDRTGVLSRISTMLSDNSVSIKAATQRSGREEGTATIVFLTHRASERSVKAALRSIGDYEHVRRIDSMIRVL